MVKDADPANTIFCVSQELCLRHCIERQRRIPYGTKGFITVKKGGDASVFRVGQATAGGLGQSWYIPEFGRL